MTALAAPPRMTALDGGVEDGITWAIVRAPLYGAVNGYAQIPEGHPWQGLDYDDDALDNVHVNGGLTFARDGWIGFDTLHFNDFWPHGGQPHFCPAGGCDCTFWTADLVADEARALARQVAEAAR